MARTIEARQARKSKVNEVWAYLVNLIESGALKQGDKLPVTKSLCKQFSTTTNVVGDARKLLVESGLVHVYQGPENGYAVETIVS